MNDTPKISNTLLQPLVDKFWNEPSQINPLTGRERWQNVLVVNPEKELEPWIKANLMAEIDDASLYSELQ